MGKWDIFNFVLEAGPRNRDQIAEKFGIKKGASNNYPGSFNQQISWLVRRGYFIDFDNGIRKIFMVNPRHYPEN